MSFIGLGKIILLGEHSVVYGYPALAAALDRGLRIGAVPTPAGGTLRLDIPSWKAKLSWQDDHPLARALTAIADTLDIGRPPVTLVGEAQIPLGAGLGGSAAFGVAIARALLDVRDGQRAAAVDLRTPGGMPRPPGNPRVETEPNPEKPPALDDARTSRSRDEVLAAANASEQLLHGRASGVDTALSASGGIGVFRKATGLRPLRVPALRVIVGPSGAQRSTAAMIKRVAHITAGIEDDPRLRELGTLTDNGTRSLLGGDIAALGAAMDRAHALLTELGVSTPVLDDLCDTARRAGAHGAKLTGAGGGGAVIAIAPRAAEPAVLAAWRAKNVDGFVAQIGGNADVLTSGDR